MKRSSFLPLFLGFLFSLSFVGTAAAQGKTVAIPKGTKVEKLGPCNFKLVTPDGSVIKITSFKKTGKGQVTPGAAGILSAQTKAHNYLGITGGLSLFTASSVDAMSFPGINPSRPVIGVFMTNLDYTDNEDSYFEVTGKLEALYLAQSAFYDVLIRDDLGNIIEAIKVECSRKYFQIDMLSKTRLAGKGRVTLAFLAGPALAIPLKTSWKPDVENPPPAKYKRAILSCVFGAGMEAKVGRSLLSLDVRYDMGFDTLSWARLDPKPDALLILAGIGF